MMRRTTNVETGIVVCPTEAGLTSRKKGRVEMLSKLSLI
jgi:hypothetical protein